MPAPLTVAIRPPEYFPGLPYCALMAQADVFVVADTFQYSRQSFQNRARLRTPQGRQWITIPLQAHQHGRPIRQVAIEHRERWARSHGRALAYNYRSSPYFEYFESTLASLLESAPPTLGPFTSQTVTFLHEAFGLSSQLIVASALVADAPTPGAGASLADLLTRLDLPADAVLLSPASAWRHDQGAVAPVSPFSFNSPTYRQVFEGFVPDLSALDLLLNEGPEARHLLLATA
ncbi:MAG: WbqC family protein [Bacteroidota bacterium]